MDRFLATNSWRDFFQTTTVSHLGFHSSDHRPILLNCQAEAPFLRGSVRNFRFETFWLKEVDYGDIVKSSWDEMMDRDPSKNLKKKLARCAYDLNKWSADRFGNLKKQINAKVREI